MRALLACVILLSGCVSPAPSADECDLLYPDGSPVPCDVTHWTEAWHDGRPAVEEGWKCVQSYQDANGQLFELYTTLDARVGMYWQWTYEKNGTAFQRLAVMSAPGEGRAVHVPYQPSGFVAFEGDFADEGPVHIELAVRIVEAWVLLEGEWSPAPGELMVTDHGVDPWMVQRIDLPGGSHYLDVNRPNPDESDRNLWLPADLDTRLHDTEILVEGRAMGVTYTSADMRLWRATTGGCLVDA